MILDMRLAVEQHLDDDVDAELDTSRVYKSATATLTPHQHQHRREHC